MSTEPMMLRSTLMRRVYEDTVQLTCLQAHKSVGLQALRRGLAHLIQRRREQRQQVGGRDGSRQASQAAGKACRRVDQDHALHQVRSRERHP